MEGMSYPTRRLGAAKLPAMKAGRRPAAAPDKRDWRATAGAIGGLASVLLVAAGLFYTNDANRNQQELTLQGQIAVRFSTAINQLGQEQDDKLSVRLGGVYALQRLMVDSPRDEPVVLGVLCAFVRSHAPRPAVRPREVPPAPADVRAAVAAIGARPHPERYPVDISGTLLGLGHMSLPGARLAGANLSGSALFHADLTGAKLIGADLHDANLHDAVLTGADLTGADLTGANLAGANLSGATVTADQLARARVDARTRLPAGH